MAPVENRQTAYPFPQLQSKLSQYFETQLRSGQTHLVPLGREAAGTQRKSSERMMKSDTYCREDKIMSPGLRASPNCDTVNEVSFYTEPRRRSQERTDPNPTAKEPEVRY